MDEIRSQFASDVERLLPLRRFLNLVVEVAEQRRQKLAIDRTIVCNENSGQVLAPKRFSSTVPDDATSERICLICCRNLRGSIGFEM